MTSSCLGSSSSCNNMPKANLLHKSHIYVYDISYVSAHWCKYHISLPIDETVYEQYPVETLHAKHVNLHLLLPQIDGSNQTRLQRGSTSYSTNFLPLVWYNDFRWWHGPLTKYVKLRVANAPGMPGTFSTPMRFSDPGMHHGTCVTHVPWCMPGSLTGDFHWSRWRNFAYLVRGPLRVYRFRGYETGFTRPTVSKCVCTRLLGVSGCISIDLQFPLQIGITH